MQIVLHGLDPSNQVNIKVIDVFQMSYSFFADS